MQATLLTRLVTTASLIALFCGATACSAADAHWPQFRGPGGLGVASNANPPIHFGPQSNVVWKIALPSGHSSPIIWGNRIFLTAYSEAKLETLCLDRLNGRILWRQPAPAEKIEPTHRISNPAASTPATDGERVFVYFGSFGLLAYDVAGKEQWRFAM